MASTLQLLISLLTVGGIATSLADEIPKRKIQELQALLNPRVFVDRQASPNIPKTQSINPSDTTAYASASYEDQGEERRHRRNKRSRVGRRRRRLDSSTDEYTQTDEKRDDKPRVLSVSSESKENKEKKVKTKRNTRSSGGRPHVYGVSGSNIRIYHGGRGFGEKQKKNSSSKSSRSKPRSFSRRPENSAKPSRKGKPKIKSKKDDSSEQHEFDFIHDPGRTRARRGRRHDSMGWSVESYQSDTSNL